MSNGLSPRDRHILERLVGRVGDLDTRVGRLSRAQDTRLTTIQAGDGTGIQLTDGEGKVLSRIGGAGALAGNAVEHVSGPDPAKPGTPVVVSDEPGVFWVELADNPPADLRVCRVLASLEPGNPGVPVGSIWPGEDVTTVSAPAAGVWHVRIQWVTLSGKKSEPSSAVTVEVAPLVDADEIQEALDEAQERLEEAEKDFQEGNDQRKQEIENLRDTVIPDLRESLEEGLSDEVTRLEGMITTAGGTSILRGVGDPEGKHDPAELPAGAYYFQYDTLNADGQLEGIWVVVETEVGNEWSQSDLDETILPQVHVEQGTYGELHGGRLIANSIETSALAVNDWENLIVDSDLRELRSAELVNEATKVSTQWASMALSGNHWTAQETNSGRTYIVAPEDDQYSVLIFTKSGVGIPASAGESFLISMKGEGEITDVTFQVAGMDENYRQTFSINAVEGANLGADFRTEFTIPEDTSTGLPTEMFQFFIERGGETSGSGRWRITQFRRKTPGVLIEDGAVKAQNVDVEELFADSAVIDKIWADIVRARMLTAEEAFIGGALIRDNTIDVEKINVTEELTAAIGQFLKVKADMLEANAIDGMTITGATVQTKSEPQRGIKVRAAENDIIAYDSNGAQRFRLNGNTGEFTASSIDNGSRTSVSAKGLEVLEDWSSYPDPGLTNPELNESRNSKVDGWDNWITTDSGGRTLYPDLRLYDVVFSVTIHSLEGLEIRGHSRSAPQDGTSYWTTHWRTPTETGLRRLKMTNVTVGERPYFAWIGLYGDVTMEEMWFEPKDDGVTQTLLSVTKDGIKAWDSSGSETASLGGGGQNFIAGRLTTNSPGQPGVVLSEDRGPSSSQGAGIWFSDDGSDSEYQAAIWAQSKIGTAPYTTYDILNVRAPQGGNVRHRSRSYFNELVDFDGHVNVYGTLYIRNNISIQISRTTSYNANLYLDSYGLMYKSTSASRYKTDQQVMDVSDDMLDLELKDWIDKAQVDRREAAEAKLANLGPGGMLTEEDAADLDNPINRIPGVVAEDVEAIDDRFVLYNDDGQVENVMYDRLALTWLPIVRRQRDRIAALEQKNADLEKRLARLEDKML